MKTRIQLSRTDERNVHSQYGEDGILARIFAVLGIESGMAVEFGAWDGVHLSNTALLREQGWSTVLIEGDDSKVQRLRTLADSKTIVIGAMVAPEGASSLDSLLDGVKVEAVDLLSIDIDGDDIHILSSLRRRPKVICIEFNPTMAPPVRYANPRGTAKGSSICAFHDVATRLGYELVYATYVNAFFVERASAAAFVSVSPFEAFHTMNRPSIVCYPDGEFGVSGTAHGQYRHAWSTLPVFMPSLPKALLGWPPTLSKVFLAYLYCAIVAPFFYLKALAKEGASGSFAIDLAPDRAAAARARMKVAVVHEWLIDWAGSEQVVRQILECYPEADLFALADFLPDSLRARVRGKRATTSFLQHMPSARAALWRYLPLMPFAIERLDVSGYDLVISSSHAVAKGVRTSPDQVHVSYVHSPMRYAWDLEQQYLQSRELNGPLRRAAARRVFRYLRRWDVRTSKNPQALIANSQFVAQRIRRVWNRDASVVYPPVDTQRFTPGTGKSDFFLCASRLHYYKRFDIIVKAFASLPDLRLVVIGEGPELGRLQAIATSNVSFLGYQPDDVLTDHLQRARALLFAAEEDFGILPVEAQACGTPVIALGKGGALETVRGLADASPTGVFFPEQDAAAVHTAVREFLANEGRLVPAVCRDNALRFSEQTFRTAFCQFVDGALQRA